MTRNEREALLREVVLGERSVDDPAVAAAAAEDSVFAAELDSLRSVVDSLETAGVLQEVQRERRHATPVLERRPSRRWLAISAVAAAAALAVLVWKPWSGGVNNDPHLGGDSVRIVYPADGVAKGYSHFAWALPSGLSRARVTVFDVGSSVERDQEFTSELEWRPAPERHARWPDAVEIEVQPIDDSDWPVGRPIRFGAIREAR